MVPGSPRSNAGAVRPSQGLGSALAPYCLLVLHSFDGSKQQGQPRFAVGGDSTGCGSRDQGFLWAISEISYQPSNAHSL